MGYIFEIFTGKYSNLRGGGSEFGTVLGSEGGDGKCMETALVFMHADCDGYRHYTFIMCTLGVFSYMPLCVLDLTKVFQPFLGILLKIVVERYSTQINKKTVQAWTKK